MAFHVVVDWGLPEWVGLAATVVAAGAAVWAVLIGRKALRIAEGDLKTTLLELRRRAVFSVEAILEGAAELAVERTAGQDVTAIVRVKILNTGTRGARDVLINALGPTYLSAFHFSDVDGRPIDETRRSIPSDEHLEGQDGHGVPAQLIDAQIPYASVRHHRLWWVTMTLPASVTVSSIPLKLIVDSDDLGESQPKGAEVTCQIEVREHGAV